MTTMTSTLPRLAAESDGGRADWPRRAANAATVWSRRRVAWRVPRDDHARRAASADAPLPGWFALVLDEIDYGVLLAAGDGRLLYANHKARRELQVGAALRLLDADRLEATSAADAPTLRLALAAAATKGLRRIVSLGADACAQSVAVVPMPGWHDGSATVLLVLGKSQVCESLSSFAFGAAHGLTPAESAVLTGLADGRCPSSIARGHGVAISTVRTQIASIRDKTGAASIGELLRLVARLPPLVGALRS